MTVRTAPDPLSVSGYLDFLDREYLTGYIDGGGAAVKLLSVGDQVVAEQLASGLAGVGSGFQHVRVDAAETRIHMIDQVFAAVATQIDWVELAGDVVRLAFAEAGFPVPGRDLSITGVARHHDIDTAELYRSVRRAVERLVLADERLTHEFRTAMLRLCQERLGRGDVTAEEREIVLCWLRCERLPLSELRKLSLHTKINRANARSMLLSLTHWLRLAGRPGLVLHLDLTRLGVVRRPPIGLRTGLYYSKAAALDAYELLRQLIDGTDEYEGLLVCVVLPAALITDEVHGLPSYTALQLRVVDEVRDRNRANPYAALVRIGPQPEENS
jgi:BREX system ATP-binding protein BrxC/D